MNDTIGIYEFKCYVNVSPIFIPQWKTISRSFEYNAKGQLTGYETTVSSETTYTDYTLDTMGNPTSITVSTDDPLDTPVTRTLSWGEGRMLTGITIDTNNYIHYTYNADGLRIRKTVCTSGIETTTDYIWYDGKLQAERCGNRIITLLYDSADSPMGFLVQETQNGITTAAQYRYLKNLQGDVTHILDEDGETVAVFRYDPWGQRSVKGNSAIAELSPCSYRGYYYDQETGWYYLQSRYYDPEIGRFLNADEAERVENNATKLTSFNIFAYCENAPITKEDSLGKGPVYLVGGGFQIEISWGALVFGMEAVWFYKDAKTKIKL